MISLCVIPAMTGTIADQVKIAFICLLLDSLYIVPIILGSL